jgi:hypothetical protein
VRTIVVSDLHVGSARHSDLVRRPELRASLLDVVRGADRLVILGDGVELRDRPKRDIGELAAPVFHDLGKALGPHGELVIVAGNHDHGLVAGWIDGRLETEPSGFLGLEQFLEPAEAGPLAAMLAGHAAPARVRIAYPGLWLADGVYAIHGHYSDVHTTVPTFERLATGAMARWVVRLPQSGATPDDYEAVLAPMYAWMSALTQRSEHAVVSAGAGAPRALGSRSPATAAAATPCGPPRSAPATWRPSARSTPPGSGRWTATCPGRRCAAATCAASARSSRGSASARAT